jgi:hypothetical protein
MLGIVLTVRIWNGINSPLTFKGKNSTHMNKISDTKFIIQAQAIRRLLLVMTVYKIVHTKYLSHLTEWVLDRWHWYLTNCNTCEWYVLQRKLKLHTDSKCESEILGRTTHTSIEISDTAEPQCSEVWTSVSPTHVPHGAGLSLIHIHPSAGAKHSTQWPTHACLSHSQPTPVSCDTKSILTVSR